MNKKEKVAVYKAPSIEEYKAMSPADKRITIAKDVIAALNNEIYSAKAGSYINELEVDGEYMYSTSDNSIREKDIQQLLPKMKNCEVCAMGACILSITKYENKLKWGDVGATKYSMSEKTNSLIKEVFSPEQLVIIEIMFEGWYTGVSCEYINEKGEEMESDHASGANYGRDVLKGSLSKEDVLQCLKWHYDNHWDDERKAAERMKAIYTVLIDHGGEIDVNKLNQDEKATE